MALLNCEFDSARDFISRARDAAAKSGHSQTATAVQSNLGHLHLLVGEFARAREAFTLLLDHPHAGHFTRLAAADGLARVHLALGDLDACAAALGFIDKHSGERARLKSTYQTRWATITRARLLIRLGTPQEAIADLTIAEDVSEAQGDLPLAAAIQLTHAQALAAAGVSDGVAYRLFRASELGITGIRELQAQYYCGSAKALPGTTPLAEHLRERADRVWSDQQVVSIRLEMDDSPSNRRRAATEAKTRPNVESTVACVVDSLAAFSNLAHRPRLLAEEMVVVLKEIGCTSGVKVVETHESIAPPADSRTTAVLRLGTNRRNTLSLICEIPADPVKAILLADVLRIGRAALELERSRQEERNRAAVWPAMPIEEEAGALFLAEEMQQLLATVRRIASSTVPVVITGETGTGKEVLARTLHLYSARAAATFLPFNCSSIHKDMLESQLFGHRRGSFTGATDNFPGVIRAASGGTLFLDEIAELSLDVQPKLLRFLESNEIHPMGDTQPVRADVRLVAATNADLGTLVAQGRFREDLFYRLNIVPLHVPPLRERRIEIPALANYYLRKYALEYRRGDLRLAEETMEYLVLYRWPGNVRQLANEMRRLAALAEAGAVLMPEHLSAMIAASRRTVPASERTLDPTEVVVRIDQPMPAAVQHLERTMIQHALQTANGGMEDAAAMLGLSRKGLYLKRVRYGLEPPESSPHPAP
jgi:DNA-binding NtrC family response regulator